MYVCLFSLFTLDGLPLSQQSLFVHTLIADSDTWVFLDVVVQRCDSSPVELVKYRLCTDQRMVNAVLQVGHSDDMDTVCVRQYTALSEINNMAVLGDSQPLTDGGDHWQTR